MQALTLTLALTLTPSPSPSEQPQLATAPIFVHLLSDIAHLNRVMAWGVLSDRGSWPRAESSIFSELVAGLFPFTASSMVDREGEAERGGGERFGDQCIDGQQQQQGGAGEQAVDEQQQRRPQQMMLDGLETGKGGLEGAGGAELPNYLQAASLVPVEVSMAAAAVRRP
jgi:hypothetical protein